MGLLVALSSHRDVELVCPSASRDTPTATCCRALPEGHSRAFREAGNPNEAEYHSYMLSYSPMHNVRPGATYPAILIVVPAMLPESRSNSFRPE